MHLWQPRRNAWVFRLEFTSCQVFCKRDFAPGMIRDLEQKHGPVRHLLAEPEARLETKVSVVSDSKLRMDLASFQSR